MESMDGLLGNLEMVDYKLVGKCLRAERYCNVRVTYNIVLPHVIGLHVIVLASPV